MLEIKDLEFSYGSSRQLIKSFNLNLHQRDIIHIKGSNGKGKSTLIKLVAGLLTPQKGTISWLEDQDSLSSSSRCEYLAPENNGLNDELSALQNLLFWVKLKNRDIADQSILSTLDDWGLKGILVQKHLNVGRYSTGMKRRLALARIALSHSPLWLFDEPTYGLDAEALKNLKKLLETHQSKGGITMMVSHEPGELSSLFTKSLEVQA